MIPERYRPGIMAIRALSPEAADELVTALANAPMGPNTASIMQAAGVARSIQRAKLSMIIEALVSLGVVLYESNLDLGTLAHDVVNAMSEMAGGDHAIQQDEALVLERRFQRLLDCRSLMNASKAIGLRTDFPNTFCDAKILTDVRPVFGDDPKQPPSGAIITHTLKIEYHHGGGRPQEFYVGLDAEDVDTLARAVQRARDKSSSLRDLLQRAGTADLDAGAKGTQE
jgi:hypothetical protein